MNTMKNHFALTHRRCIKKCNLKVRCAIRYPYIYSLQKSHLVLLARAKMDQNTNVFCSFKLLTSAKVSLYDGVGQV